MGAVFKGFHVVGLGENLETGEREIILQGSRDEVFTYRTPSYNFQTDYSVKMYSYLQSLPRYGYWTEYEFWFDESGKRHEKNRFVRYLDEK